MVVILEVLAVAGNPVNSKKKKSKSLFFISLYLFVYILMTLKMGHTLI